MPDLYHDASMNKPHKNQEVQSEVKRDPNFMLSLARGLDVLNAFTPQRQRLTISQLSQKTQISRAAVRRCLYTLATLGMVHSPDGRHYELLPRVLTVGHAYLAGTPLAKVAQTALDTLSQTLNHSCSVATLDGDNVLYIARTAVDNLMSVDIGRGSRLPAWVTSMGRVLLSALPEEELDVLLKRTKLLRHTQHTVTSLPLLREEIALVRRQGYAINDQELEIGLRSVAVPMLARGGKVVAAMNVGLPATLVSLGDVKTQILPSLRRAAAELSMSL